MNKTLRGKFIDIQNKTLWNKAYSFAMLALAFLIPYLILLNVFKHLGFYPYGEKSLLIMDMDSNYVQFYESLQQIISGESSIFFSWSKALGSNYIGLFAFNLSSPLSLITLFFGSENIQLAIFYLTLIKISLCGVTFYLYFKYVFKYDKFPILIFTTSYALISYSIIYSLCPMWIEGVILLPLILLGAEKVLRKEKPYVFIISLAVMLISNYYIAYMVCIFSALFIVYRYFTTDTSISFLGFLKMVGKFLVYALVSVGLSLWFTLPVLFDLTSGKIGYANYTPDTLANFPIKDYLLSFKPNTYTSITNSGLPALYAGVLISIMCVLFFILRSISLRKKLLTLLFFAFLLCSFYFTKLEIAWHVFRYPNWFPYRNSFIFHFFAIFVASSAFIALKDWFAKVTNKAGKLIPVLIPIITLVFVSFDLYNNSKALITGLDNQFQYKDVNKHADFRDENLSLIENVKNSDTSFYRLEKTYNLTLNDPLGMGYKGMTHYSSTFNRNLLSLSKKLGFAQNWFWSSYVGSTPLTDSVLNFKYIMSKEEMPKEYKKHSMSGEITVYENPYVLPIAFMVDKNASNIYIESFNYFENQNNMLNRFCGNDAKYFIEVEGISNSNDKMSYSFTAKNDYPVYLSFPAGNNTGGSLYVNGQYVTNYFTSDDNHIVYIGQFEAGTDITVAFNTNRENVSLLGEHIYYLDTDELSSTMQKLNDGGLYNLSYKNSHIKAEVNAANDGIMFTSIPYDKGFTIKIDGKKTEYTSLNDTFMIFNVKEGHHDIEISFIPDGFMIGLGISIVSLLLLILHVLYTKGIFSRTRKTMSIEVDANLSKGKKSGGNFVKSRMEDADV